MEREEQRPTNEASPGEHAVVDIPSDTFCLPLLIVNVCLVGARQAGGGWVLIDAGVGNQASRILEVAEERFGEGSRPHAIILTHGHFDHVGSLHELLAVWDVPVYAHPQEMPYLTGKADYPPGDPTVGGGLMAAISPMYPNRGIDLGERVHPLPEDGSIPFLPEWKWVHTPGHTPGHVSLFRERDRTMIAGDAFITVKQEAALAVITQEQEIHGPPTYFTPNWDQAWESVKKLAALQPAVAITGHGVPMTNPELSLQLSRLAREFDRLAIPEQGRYVH